MAFQLVYLEQKVPPSLQGGVVALGNFDGVHLGHKAVLSQTIALAKDKNLPAVAVSFSPHPRQFFKKFGDDFLLTPVQLKAARMKAMGMDGLMIIPFNQALANLSADQFINHYLINHCNASEVVLGYDFHFGKDRQGNPDSLKANPVFLTTVIEPKQDEHGGLYASSTIRDFLDTGDITSANAMLGYAYKIEGIVIKGQQLGRTLGFPTANFSKPAQKMPRFGVYAVQLFDGDQWLADGVANYGIKPTLSGEQAPVFEVHAFNFDQDLYDKTLQTTLIDFIRSEQKFSSLDELKQQISQDCNAAQAVFDKMGFDKMGNEQ